MIASNSQLNKLNFISNRGKIFHAVRAESSVIFEVRPRDPALKILLKKLTIFGNLNKPDFRW